MSEKQKKKFYVVEFVDEKSVSVVSHNWLNDSRTSCSWPSVPSSLKKLLNHEPPEPNWPKFACQILKGYGKVY